MTRPLGAGAEVRFLCPDTDLLAAVAQVDDIDSRLGKDAALRAAFARGGTAAWTVLTWLRLREAGYGGMTIAPVPAEDAINIATAQDLQSAPWWRRAFCVAVEADFPRIWWAQLQIQQNRANCRPGDLFMRHWPQPALIPRRDRPHGTLRVGFYGKAGGNLAGTPEAWRAMLAARGFEFHAPGVADWHDYSSIDIAVGIRSFDRRRWDKRPASKLVNAWLAGVPFVGGMDSAFADEGRPGIDYLRVDSAEGLLDALERLRGDPSLGTALVAEGRVAARRYAADRLVAEWAALIEGPIAARYARWRQRPAYERARIALLGPGHAGWERAKRLRRRLIGRGDDAA